MHFSSVFPLDIVYILALMFDDFQVEKRLSFLGCYANSNQDLVVLLPDQNVIHFVHCLFICLFIFFIIVVHPIFVSHGYIYRPIYNFTINVSIFVYHAPKEEEIG